MAGFETLSLLVETRRLLKERRHTLEEIHHATRLPFHWLEKMLYNGVKDPSVNRVQKLYEFLTGSPLLTPGDSDRVA